MSKGRTSVPMHDRVRAQPTPADAPSDGSERNLNLPQHCWVNDGRGRRPGVLLEWKSTTEGWQGRVAYAVPSTAGVRLVEQWLSAATLHPVS